MLQLINNLKMPKLLQIVVECNTGSTGTIAEAIGNIAIKNGWESYIAYGRPYKPSNSYTYKIESKCGVYIHGLLTRIFDAHGKGSLIATKKLIKYVKTIKPDIIHLHHLHGYYINIRILFDYLSSSNIPVVWTFHDCWSFTGHCAYFDYVSCNRWQTECYNCPQKKEYPASYVFDRSKRNYKEKRDLFTSVSQMTIISVSKWLDEKVSQSFFKEITHKVIYNGIDTNIFKPSSSNDNVEIRNKYEIGKSFLILGVASPWSKRKGLDDFIKLSYSLNQNEKILLIGLNDKQIQSLPKNIIGVKKTENKQELVNLYSAADVYINLSVEETFGLTTAEALACGTPAIVYKSTACPEIIDDFTGIAVEKKNISAVINAINIIKIKGKNYYSLYCRERAIKYFNKDDRFNDYLILYNDILNQC
jgi:glycosyltransferase involved in cell wall biosynthesis